MFYNQSLKRNLDLHSLTLPAIKALNNDVILHYRCFKQTWSNTGTVWAHPGSDMWVGAAFTIAKVTVFYGKRGSAAVYVGDELAYVIDHPNQKFKDDVHNKSMTYVSDAHELYERNFHHVHDFWDVL